MQFRLTIIFIIFIFSCTSQKQKTEGIELIGVRDSDTLHIKITNHSDSIIFIPENYVGTYNTDNDSIFLEVVDKPKFNLNYYYRYSNIFPFQIYLAKKIPGIEPDTVIKITNQTYYFNQFLVQPFVAVQPDSSFVRSLIFHVPAQAKIVQAVYYRKPFLKENKSDNTVNYNLEDWIKFDSLNSNYVNCTIANRYYLDK